MVTGGVLITNDSCVELAPVYDNGNGLNDKWNDVKMQKFLLNEELLLSEAYKGKVYFFTLNDKRLNPFSVIESRSYKECAKALNELMNQTTLDDILKPVNECEQLSDIQHQFYKEILTLRFNKLKQFEDFSTIHAFN